MKGRALLAITVYTSVGMYLLVLYDDFIVGNNKVYLV